MAPRNRFGATSSLRPEAKVAAVAHAAGDAQQRDRIEVEHRLGLRVVALADVVAGQAEDIAHAQGGRAQDVALQRDAIAVAAGDLADRREAGSRPGSRRRRRSTCGNWRRRRR